LLVAFHPLSFRPPRVSIERVNVHSLYSHPRHRSFVLGESRKRALLLHGFPGTPAELRPIAEFLLTLGFQVEVPLLPGFGVDIGALGRTKWQDWVEATTDAWKELAKGAETTVLLGFSVSAAVALHAAAQVRPDRLVLIAPFWRLADARAGWLPLVRYAVPQLKPFQGADFTSEVVRAQFRRLEPTLDLGDPAVQRTLREEVALPTSSLVEVQRLGRSAYRLAPGVTAPTLIFQGLSDTTVLATDTRRLALRLGGTITLSELEGDHQLIGAQEAGHRELLDGLRQNLGSNE
jgi:carboxylesterase